MGGSKIQSSMKRIVFAMYILTLVFSADAEEFTAVENEQEFRQQYRHISEQIETLEADFVQEKKIQFLDNTLHSSGRMIFKNDNRLKIEYFKPNDFVFALYDGKITVKNGAHKSSVMATHNRLFEQISRITMYAINGKIFESKEFGATIFENDNRFMIVLVPKSKELKQYYTTLNLYIDKRTFMIEKTVMKETSGDETTMCFKNITTNNTIPNEAFAVD
jgi:outer membrane lipoprotein carrier protein